MADDDTEKAPKTAGARLDDALGVIPSGDDVKGAAKGALAAVGLGWRGLRRRAADVLAPNDETEGKDDA